MVLKDTEKKRPETVPATVVKSTVACSNLYITVGMDDNGQPIEVFINGSKSGGCYDDKTEVLTEMGWKFFKDLNKTEKMATLNLENNTLEYQIATAFQDYIYEGVMYELKGKSYDLFVTPDHRLLYRKKTSRKEKRGFILNKVESIVNKESKVNTPNLELNRVCTWHGTNDNTLFVLPALRLGKEEKNKRIKLKYESDISYGLLQWLTFFGYYLSEGCVNGSEVSLFQKKDSPYFDKMKLSVLGLNITPNIFIRKNRNNNGRIRFSNARISSYLSQFGKSESKFIPREFLNLPKEYLRTLAQSMFEGDGSFDKNGDFRTYTTVSPRLADDVSELLVKLGYGVTVSKIKQKNTFVNGKEIIRQPYCYLVGVSKVHNTPEFMAKNIKQKMYKGRVFCCTVQNSTLLIRRNGKIVWCGNCKTNQDAIGRLVSALLRNNHTEEVLKQLTGLVCASCQRMKGELPKEERANYPLSCGDAVARAIKTAMSKNK